VYNSGISRPFRETDYEPEMFMTFPIDREGAGLRARFVNFGLVHQSNGRADPLSRSWNRIYGKRGFHQFQCVVPYTNGDVALRRLLEAISSCGAPSFLSVLKRLGPGRAGYLSFPMEGYTLAVDFPNSIDATCPAPGPTTTTSTVVAVTTSTTSTTSSTLPENQGLHVTGARVRAGAGSGSVRAQGDFQVPPAITVPPSFTVRLRDGASLDRTHEFNACKSSNGRIRCREQTSEGVFRAVFRPYRGSANTLRFKVSFVRQTISGPFAAPVTMVLTHNAAVVRSDGIVACTSSASALRCRE